MNIIITQSNACTHLANEVVREIDERFQRFERAIEKRQETGAAHFGQLRERVNRGGFLVQVACDGRRVWMGWMGGTG